MSKKQGHTKIEDNKESSLLINSIQSMRYLKCIEQHKDFNHSMFLKKWLRTKSTKWLFDFNKKLIDIVKCSKTVESSYTKNSESSISKSFIIEGRVLVPYPTLVTISPRDISCETYIFDKVESSAKTNFESSSTNIESSTSEISPNSFGEWQGIYTAINECLFSSTTEISFIIRKYLYKEYLSKTKDVLLFNAAQKSTNSSIFNLEITENIQHYIGLYDYQMIYKHDSNSYYVVWFDVHFLDDTFVNKIVSNKDELQKFQIKTNCKINWLTNTPQQKIYDLIMYFGFDTLFSNYLLSQIKYENYNNGINISLIDLLFKFPDLKEFV